MRHRFGIAAASAAAILLAACSGGGTPQGNGNNGQGDFGDIGDCTPVVAAVSPEKVNLFTDLANKFEQSSEYKVLAKCAKILPYSVSSGEGARLLKL